MRIRLIFEGERVALYIDAQTECEMKMLNLLHERGINRASVSIDRDVYAGRVKGATLICEKADTERDG